MREAPPPSPGKQRHKGGSKKDMSVKKTNKTTIASNMERLTATLRSSRILFFLKGKANQKRITATWVSKEREEKGGERPESEGRANCLVLGLGFFQLRCTARGI